MFYGLLIFLHVIICMCLIVIVLIQAGRGGGLAENFSSAESIFGTKTNALLTRATTIFAITFFITCLSLAVISKQRSKSLINTKNIPSVIPQKEIKPEASKETKADEIPKEAQAPPVQNQNKTVSKE